MLTESNSGRMMHSRDIQVYPSLTTLQLIDNHWQFKKALCSSMTQNLAMGKLASTRTESVMENPKEEKEEKGKGITRKRPEKERNELNGM